MIRLAIRGFIGGAKQFEDRVDVSELGEGFEDLAEKHALRLLALPGGDKHMIEIEFLDETLMSERFFRFGTDPAGTVIPLEIPGSEDAARLYEKMPTRELLCLQKAHELDLAEAASPLSIAFGADRLALIAAELKKRDLPGRKN